MASSLGKGVGEYRKQAVSTASPLQLVLMLYDAALKHCDLALEAIRSGNLQAQHDNLIKAQRVVSELAASLDMKQGGEIAQNLFGLYSYCLDQLSEANIGDKTQPVERTVRVLQELREAWQQIQETVGREEADAA